MNTLQMALTATLFLMALLALIFSRFVSDDTALFLFWRMISLGIMTSAIALNVLL